MMHARGPWRVEPFGPAAIRNAEGQIVVMLDHAKFQYPGGEQYLANVRLMAAAPELLEACQTALDWLDRSVEHAPIALGGGAELAGALRAAVAKATGGQS